MSDPLPLLFRYQLYDFFYLLATRSEIIDCCLEHFLYTDYQASARSDPSNP